MHHVSTQLQSAVPAIPNSRGGRISSPALRQATRFSEEFPGLDKTTNRYDLLLLVKRAGKSAGFSSKMIQLLDYYMAFTREIDWEEGARPIIYQSLSKTALDLGVSERHIQRLEQALFEAGALSWNDSGNHRRCGQRCKETGVILYAFGVNLTPLADLKSKLETKLQEKELYDRAWMEAKRQISWHRRQICALLSEGEERGELPLWLKEAAATYETLIARIRTYQNLEALRSILAKHKTLYQDILARIKEEGAKEIAQPEQISVGNPGEQIVLPAIKSSRDDKNVAHYNSTNQESSDKSDGSPSNNCFRGSVPQLSRPKPDSAPASRREEGGKEALILGTGLQRISPKQALNAASERFRAHIPLAERPMNWNDLVEAAYRLKRDLQISQDNWGAACITLGRAGAAVCLLLTDQAMQRQINPVRKPGAYFRAMVKRARTGELHLHSSIFGILKREEGC